MALRLVQPTDGSASPQSPPSPSGVQPAALLQRAGAQLRARDLAGWRKTFDAAAEIDGVHARYATRRSLLEQLGSVQGLSAPDLAATLLAGAQATCDLLEDEPREPVLLNGAGALLFELGVLSGAEALFRAAKRLDPELPHVDDNLAACKRRRKLGRGVPAGLPPQVRRELKPLSARAEKVADRARPATDLTLSLCMIVKDEEAMLPRCLAAVRDWVDEIVVVDTGSTDRTVQIAEDFGARVLHHEWSGDFAAARNVSFDAATGDWLMFLDADEVLVEGDGPKLRALTGKVWREAMFLVETNYTGAIEDGVASRHNALRVFRNRPEYRFEGRIHEQISHKLPAIPERLEVTDVRIEHYGYLGVVRESKNKSQRNIELLERQVEEGNDTPFVRFNLGAEYDALDRHEEALEQFRKAWDKLKDDPNRARYGYYPSFCSRFVRVLYASGHHDEAVETGERVLRELPEFTDIVLHQAWALRHKGSDEEAIERFKKAIEMGDAPPKYSAAVGAGTFLALTGLAEALLARGDVEGAAKQLRRSLEEHPRYIGAVEPYARALLRLGRAPADIAAEIHRLVPDLPPAGRFQLAVPLYEAGAVQEAEVELRAVLDAQPSAQPARLALAEALLSQGRLDEAATEAARIPAEAPLGPSAARSLLFARLAAWPRDEDAVAEAFDYARRAELPAPELAALEAWRELRNEADSVPAEAAPLLAVMLEALARLEDFDGFERLAFVVEGLALPWRERRELMAGVYLRRGFVDLAADEWIAAVEREGPDKRAMLGLAQVAELRGMDEDAAVFRAEAEKLAA